MTMAQSLLPEFDQEMANTRKTIERVPDDKLGWKPHEKSGTIGWLASHLADMPSWTTVTLNQDSFDYAPPGGAAFEPETFTSAAAAVEAFDRNVSAARAAIEKATDETLMGEWSLLAGGKVIFTAPRIIVLRGMIINHMIHHRGQLTVYLRLNDVPVPALYGPSADEGGI